jgi:hypothetical protein
MIISTIYGDMDEGLLIKSEGVLDNAYEHTEWVEYRLTDGVLVHRSAHVTLKQWPAFASGTAEQLGR